jgi:hypothetical protein
LILTDEKQFTTKNTKSTKIKKYKDQSRFFVLFVVLAQTFENFLVFGEMER